uniref:Uncharacterized protein n=1 Tax=Ixodes ricinus TaxID=34613 RepID=A0A147BF13_IXORI
MKKRPTEKWSKNTAEIMGLLVWLRRVEATVHVKFISGAVHDGRVFSQNEAKIGWVLALEVIFCCFFVYILKLRQQSGFVGTT